MIDAQKSIDFLLKEYSENYTHMRHYDNLSHSFIKFNFTFDLAVLSAGVTIYHYFKDKEIKVAEPIGFLLILGFIVGVLFLSLAVRNRVYFVPVTRHINRIRRYFKENMEIQFDFGDMYINPRYPKYFNAMSTYSLMFYLLSLLNAIILSMGLSLFFHENLKIDWWTLIVAFAGQLLVLILYLRSKEGRNADQGIHGDSCLTTNRA